jgi:hypothetical protein
VALHWSGSLNQAACSSRRIDMRVDIAPCFVNSCDVEDQTFDAVLDALMLMAGDSAQLVL